MPDANRVGRMFRTLCWSPMSDLVSSSPRPANFCKHEIDLFRSERRGLLAEVPRDVSFTVMGQVRLALTVVDEAVKLLACQAGSAQAKDVLRQALQD